MTKPKRRPPAGPPRWVWLILAVVIVLGLGTGWYLNRQASLPKTTATFHGHIPVVSGKLAQLAQGKRATVVVLIATWCKYCAYDDRYVWSKLQSTPGVAVDIVDISPMSGIGDPGPETPAFSGQDHVGQSIGASGMQSTLAKYLQVFHLSHVHAYVDPKGVSDWGVKYLPTTLFVNAKGQVVTRANGALTYSQGKAHLQHVLGQ